MTFKEAALEILTESQEPLHYEEITRRALEKGILTTTGLSPAATMGSRLYTDTLREDSLFIRTNRRGYFFIKDQKKDSFSMLVDEANRKTKEKLKDFIHSIDPMIFEELIAELLISIGVEEESIELTTFSNDGGIDVRGVLDSGGLTKIRVAVQAKRWQGNVGAPIIRQLRGSIQIGTEQGIVITSGKFTSGAIREANRDGVAKISLINGNELIDMIIKNHIGVSEEKLTILQLDEDRWASQQELIQPIPQPLPVQIPELILFPVPIIAKYHGSEFRAELLNITGNVLYNGTEYNTPTGAGRAVALEWPAVNGWTFWKFKINDEEGWVSISRLRG